MLTGGGAPGVAGTIFSLRNNPENRVFEIVCVDINSDVIGKYISDGFFQIPAPEDPTFVETILDIAKKQDIQVILPETTREIMVFSKHIEQFGKNNIAVVVSSSESILVANDKYLLLEKVKKIGLPYPEYFLTDSQKSLLEAAKRLGYPKKKVVVKPRVSNGSRGVRILTKDSWNTQKFLKEKPEGLEINLEDLSKILTRGEWPELLVMEFLPGPEYTVDVFRNNRGTVVIPRLREKIRSGITFDAKIELRKDIIDQCKNLAGALDLMYCFGFQFKLSEDGIPKIIECNPRVQGTMAASTLAGFNMIYYSVKQASAEEVDLDRVDIVDGFKFKRYWGGVGIKDNEFAGKI